MDDEERVRQLIAERTGWSDVVVEGARRYLRDTGASSWHLVRMSDAASNLDRALTRLAGVDELREHDAGWLVDHADLTSIRWDDAHSAAVAAVREGRPADWSSVGALAGTAAIAWQALAGRADAPWQVCAALHAAHRFRDAQQQAARQAS